MQDHIRAGNFKTLYSYSFYKISAKLYEDVAYYGGIQAVIFLGNSSSITNFVAL